MLLAFVYGLWPIWNVYVYMCVGVAVGVAVGVVWSLSVSSLYFELHTHWTQNC